MPRAPGGVTGEFSNDGVIPDAWRAYGWQGQPPLICARMQPADANADPSPAYPEVASPGGGDGMGATEANSHGKMGATLGGVDGEAAGEGADADADDLDMPTTSAAHGMVVDLFYDLAEVQ